MSGPDPDASDDSWIDDHEPDQRAGDNYFHMSIRDPAGGSDRNEYSELKIALPLKCNTLPDFTAELAVMSVLNSPSLLMPRTASTSDAKNDCSACKASDKCIVDLRDWVHVNSESKDSTADDTSGYSTDPDMPALEEPDPDLPQVDGNPDVQKAKVRAASYICRLLVQMASSKRNTLANYKKRARSALRKYSTLAGQCYRDHKEHVAAAQRLRHACQWMLREMQPWFLAWLRTDDQAICQDKYKALVKSLSRVAITDHLELFIGSGVWWTRSPLGEPAGFLDPLTPVWMKQ